MSVLADMDHGEHDDFAHAFAELLERALASVVSSRERLCALS